MSRHTTDFCPRTGGVGRTRRPCTSVPSKYGLISNAIQLEIQLEVKVSLNQIYQNHFNAACHRHSEDGIGFISIGGKLRALLKQSLQHLHHPATSYYEPIIILQSRVLQVSVEEHSTDLRNHGHRAKWIQLSQNLPSLLPSPAAPCTPIHQRTWLDHHTAIPTRVLQEWNCALLRLWWRPI